MITTIIPTYRRPKLLQRAIRSVLNQSYRHFQVCVYDNASGDDTARVVAEIAKEDSRVKYHCHGKNIGSVRNFNYGMKHVTTPFFSLLSDDNILLPHFFEDAIKNLNRCPEAILVASQTIMVNEKGQTVKRSVDRWKSGVVFPPDGLLHVEEKGLPNWESILFRSEVIDSVGLLNPSFGAAVDQDFIMRIARQHILLISKNHDAIFLYHNKSWSRSRDLSEIVFTYKKRLQQWYEDEELSEAVKERIRKASQIKINKLLRSYVYHRCILGEDTKGIATARDIMKKEAGFSFRLTKLITLAKIANSSRFMKRLILTYISLRGQLRLKFISMRNKVKYSGIITEIQ